MKNDLLKVVERHSASSALGEGVVAYDASMVIMHHALERLAGEVPDDMLKRLIAAEQIVAVVRERLEDVIRDVV